MTRNTKIKCISEELYTPNKLQNVEYLPNSRICEIIETFWASQLRSEAAVLPDY